MLSSLTSDFTAGEPTAPPSKFKAKKMMEKKAFRAEKVEKRSRDKPAQVEVKVKAIQKVTRKILQSHKQPQYYSLCLKDSRICKRQVLSMNCKWCAKHCNDCIEICSTICIMFSLVDIVRCQSICEKRRTMLPRKSSVFKVVKTKR